MYSIANLEREAERYARKTAIPKYAHRTDYEPTNYERSMIKMLSEAYVSGAKKILTNQRMDF